jgi:hypothetical protein
MPPTIVSQSMQSPTAMQSKTSPRAIGKHDASSPRPIGKKDPSPSTPNLVGNDLAEMALIARMQVDARQQASLSFEEAYKSLRWALDVQDYPEGIPSRPFVWIWDTAFYCLSVTVAFIMLVLMIAYSRSLFSYLETEDGTLVASGVLTYSGEEPVAATANVVEDRGLSDCGSLAIETLALMRDLVFMHGGVWRIMHITNIVMFRSQHLWLESFDGSAVRLLDGRAFFRNGALGSEEFLSLHSTQVGSNYSGWQTPRSYFRVVRGTR